MNQRIGDARVSTDDQHPNLPRNTLTRGEVRRGYQEGTSGKNTTKLELGQYCKAFRAGDTLVGWRLDNPGRNLPRWGRAYLSLDS